MFSNGKLLPILTALGTAVTTAAVLYHYQPRRKLLKLTNDEDVEEDQSKLQKTETLDTPSVLATIASDSIESEQEESDPASLDFENIPKSRIYQVIHAIMMHLQDASMLLMVFGLGLLLIVLLASLAIVGTNDKLKSPGELTLFTPLISLSMGMFIAGILNVVFRSNKRPIPIAAGLKRSESAYQTTIDEAEEYAREGEIVLSAEKRRKGPSKCPFGYG